MLDNIPSSHLRIYQGALRIIKLWAYRRYVYGLGYLGGGGWAVWLARVLMDGFKEGFLASLTETNSVEKSAEELVVYFFVRASQWPSNPIVVSLHDFDDNCEDDTKCHPLTVLAPYSQNNHGRNATRSTVQAIQSELKQAEQLVESCRPSAGSEKDVGKENRLVVVLEAENTIPFESIIRVEVSLPSPNKNGMQLVADIKAHASNGLLGLIVDLEYRLGDPTLIRPYLRPSRVKDAFVWHIGVDLADPRELKSWCERKTAELTASLSILGPTIVASIACIDG